MRLAAIMLVKDEADILPYTIKHLIDQGVEHVFVSDNMSTDGSGGMIASMASMGWYGENARITVMPDDDPAYRQSEKTTALAYHARMMGFDWVIPCDADEFWYSAFGSLYDVLELHDKAAFDVVPAELFDHITTAHDPPYEEVQNPFVRIGWRFIEPGALPKVACRLRPDLVIEQGNHGAQSKNEPGSAVPFIQRNGQPAQERLTPMSRREQPGLSIRHYSWRSRAQYLRKITNGARAYALTSLPDDVGAHWRMFGLPESEGFAERVTAHFDEWFYSSAPEDDDRLIFDPAPPEEKP